MVMKSRILYTKPSITPLEVGYAQDAAANGWGADCYKYIGRFEKLFGDYLGVRHSIATSSCTGALCRRSPKVHHLGSLQSAPLLDEKQVPV
jgi:dTDP-4-amino-4,6-dideoxygalactose transaminase